MKTTLSPLALIERLLARKMQRQAVERGPGRS